MGGLPGKAWRGAHCMRVVGRDDIRDTIRCWNGIIRDLRKPAGSNVVETSYGNLFRFAYLVRALVSFSVPPRDQEKRYRKMAELLPGTDRYQMACHHLCPHLFLHPPRTMDERLASGR